MPLFIHLFIHACLAILTGYFLGLYLGYSFYLIITAFLFGFLIDIDHFIEYFFVYKKFSLNKFFKSQQFIDSGKVYKLFHSFELVLILLFLSYLFIFNYLLSIILFTAAISLFVHLISDCLINKEKVLFYFIIYRLKNKFLLINLIDEQKIEKSKIN